MRTIIFAFALLLLLTLSHAAARSTRFISDTLADSAVATDLDQDDGSIFDIDTDFTSDDDESEVCPTLIVDPTNPQPPNNYTFLLPPILKPTFNGSWYLIDAIHSLNPSWHYERIICKYATCANYGCPTIALLSNTSFANPASPGGFWGPYSRINDTLICAPNDHSVDACPFS